MSAPQPNTQFSAQEMRAFFTAANHAADSMHHRLSELEKEVSGMLAGWQGVSGSTYSRGWETWHKGAVEVLRSLSILVEAVKKASQSLEGTDQTSAVKFKGMRSQ